MSSESERLSGVNAAAPFQDRPARGTRPRIAPPPTMPERSRVAILISGRGSNMAALIYAARATDCAYDVVLVSGDKPDAPGLDLAEAEGVPVARLPRPISTDKSLFFEALNKVLEEAEVDLIALAGFMRVIPADFVERWSGRILNIHPSLLP